MSTLGNNIKRYRILAKLTQEELATKLGKSKNVISNWERGDNKPDADMIEEMCRIFNIMPNEIYGWNETTKTIAAHFDGNGYTEKELEEIQRFAEFLRNKRNK